jgi:hypothetical protein
MPNQQHHFQCQIETADGTLRRSVPLTLQTSQSPHDLHQTVEIHDSIPSLRLTRYLPRAILRQEIKAIDQEQGQPSLKISINGPTQSFQRWLVANDPAHNRLKSFIGTWRYQTVNNRAERDELLSRFKEERTRAPTVRITRADTGVTRTIPATVAEAVSLQDIGCSVRVRAFHPHFALDDKKGQPVNLSDQLVNPAALIELAHDGSKSERWVFGRFPDYKKEISIASPYRITLDCPIYEQRSTPDFMLTTAASGTIELWTRHEGKVAAQALPLNNEIKIEESQYAFQIIEFVPRGSLRERYEVTDSKDGAPALCVETIGTDGRPVVQWLKYGTPRVLSTALGPMTIAFGPPATRQAGGHQ